jgi:hypothetical protein
MTVALSYHPRCCWCNQPDICFEPSSQGGDDTANVEGINLNALPGLLFPVRSENDALFDEVSRHFVSVIHGALLLFVFDRIYSIAGVPVT